MREVGKHVGEINPRHHLPCIYHACHLQRDTHNMALAKNLYLRWLLILHARPIIYIAHALFTKHRGECCSCVEDL